MGTLKHPGLDVACYTIDTIDICIGLDWIKLDTVRYKAFIGHCSLGRSARIRTGESFSPHFSSSSSSITQT